MSVVDLQAYLRAECNGDALGSLTVLAAGNDPFRCDTPDKRAAGAWLAEHVAGLAQPTIHLRGLHYALLGQTKPNGKPYTNTDDDWVWLGNPALKAARWTGLVPFDRITDERNAAPVVRIAEPVEPQSVIAFGNVELGLPDDLAPEADVDGFEGRQPYNLALFGEKSSLDPVLGPIAERYGTSLFLPTGELSDTMIHKLAKAGADDGRKLIVFYISDCDPAGWQMAISLGRKLQALKAGFFPDLEFEVRPVALTPDQVRAYGLPSTPLKSTEMRADKWLSAMKVEQTEIDSIATLQPELLREIVTAAISMFHDSTLDARVWEARSAWRREAQEALEAQLDPGRLERMRADAERTLADLQDEIDALNHALRIDTSGIQLPEIIVPEAVISEPCSTAPLIDSEWTFAEQSRRLIAHKNYENGATA